MRVKQPTGEKHQPETEPDADAGAQSGSEIALNRSPGFWMIVGYAVLFGVVLAFVGLAFLGLVNGGTELWFTLPKHPGWLDGSLWWVAVTAGAGLLVGVLRRVFRRPAQDTGHRGGDQRRAGQAVPRPEGRCRLAGIAGRWG